MATEGDTSKQVADSNSDIVLVVLMFYYERNSHKTMWAMKLDYTNTILVV